MLGLHIVLTFTIFVYANIPITNYTIELKVIIISRRNFTMRFKLYLSVIIILFSVGSMPAMQNKKDKKTIEVQPKITFIEFGSVNCIPCKKMQPIMKSVEKKYGGQIKVIFYDVWQPDQKKYAQQYGIKLIPTQVFLDEKGKEVFRHEGFYAEEEIDKLLKSKGLKIL
jgi:thioredoxin 1